MNAPNLAYGFSFIFDFDFLERRRLGGKGMQQVHVNFWAFMSSVSLTSELSFTDSVKPFLNS